MPGRYINDQQVRTYMRLRTDHPQMTAAAKAGLSVASARRIDLDPRPPSTKKHRRTWRTRPNPLEGLWDEEILPLLVTAPAHDSPHFHTAPKVSANSLTSASIAANRSINGTSRTSGIVGIRS